MDERTLRALIAAGGVRKVQVIGLGGRFHVEATTHTGQLTISTAKGLVKTWVTLDATARWLRTQGLGSATLSLERWQPGQKTLALD